MELSEFIYKRRTLKRITDTLSEKQSKKIIRYINDLEDEIIRLSRPTKTIKEPEGVIEKTPLQKSIDMPHLTDNWKYPRRQLELETINHLKKLDIELGERPDMRKIYCIGDLNWLELNFPDLYKKQMQNAYSRICVRESYNRKKRIVNTNGFAINFE